MTVKRDLFNSIVIPAMTYVAKCWATTRQAKKDCKLLSEQGNACFAKSVEEITHRIRKLEK